ncbi:MAG TPA: glycoside hydrolase family 3 N-terminal domain-containing protein [Actinocrinis sp.]|nr:glycoside hydrolase family 3 N-terminal domain-containing protein [Actinocrinis sp.]
MTGAGVLIVAALLPTACSHQSGHASEPAGSDTAGGSPTPATASAAPSTTAGAPLTLPPTTTAAPTTAQAAPTPAQTQLAGQRIIYSYTGLTPPADLLALIRAGQVAGVIFFADNVSSTAQLTSVVAELDQAQKASPVHLPLLLMTDQEGGQVRRLPGAPDLSEEQVGQSSNPSAQAAAAGTGAGQNLAGIGLNVNLAPVLDVYYQPGDFIEQNQRSFSNSPTVVSTLGGAFISAQQRAGVAATAKHFPGLGSAPAGADTDNGPVTLPVSLSRLRSTDEVPYRAAIASGVKLIMVSWAVYPALDGSRPAGFSPVVVQQELRSRLDYNGVTITDALEAEALDAYGTPGQRAQDAAGAGMDLILCSSGDVSQGEQASAALASALAGGQLSQSGFTAAVNRINKLRGNLS